MTKEEQRKINAECENAYNKAIAEIDHKEGKRLRSCTAWVYESEHYYFLRSYNTMIAFIDKESDTLYDILRLVYGYTSTSAQHIAKFGRDYGKGKWGCEHRFVYYEV